MCETTCCWFGEETDTDQVAAKIEGKEGLCSSVCYKQPLETSSTIKFFYFFCFFMIIWLVVLVVYKNKEKTEKESLSAKASAFATDSEPLPIASPNNPFSRLSQGLLGINDEE